MARKTFGVALGRPPKTKAARLGAPPKMGSPGPMSAPPGASPMDSFAPGLPASGFKRGGEAGFARMPHHHDDPAFAKGSKVR